MRIDKFCWCVRLFKTRSLSTKSVDAEKVKLNSKFVKSSKHIAIGDEISIKVIPYWKTYKALDIPKSRVGAKLLPELIIETTSQDILKEIENIQLINRENKSLGIKGRPTKKDRRDIDNLY